MNRGLKTREMVNRLIGDRASLIGKTIMLSGATLVNYFPPHLQGQGADHPALTLLGGLGLGLGVALAAYTGFGTTTSRFYMRTKDHLERLGKMDRRFMRKVLGNDKNRTLTGYCQLQGMYLAAREYGKAALEEFKKFKREETRNLVPNF